MPDRVKVARGAVVGLRQRQGGAIVVETGQKKARSLLTGLEVELGLFYSTIMQLLVEYYLFEPLFPILPWCTGTIL